MIYETLFWIGAVGIGAQTLLGFAHGHGHNNGHGNGHHGHHGGHDVHLHHDAGHIGHSHAPAHHAPTAHHAPVAHHGHVAEVGHSPVTHGHDLVDNGHHAHEAGDAGTKISPWIPLLSLLSPITIFSVSFGAGATGLLVGPYLTAPLTACAAGVGGVAFYSLIIRPLGGMIMKVASKPAKNLDGVLAQEAVAEGRFDAQGRGIVAVDVDGEIVRLLARLESDDHSQGVTVARGERLVVTQVDPEKNVLRVMKM